MRGRELSRTVRDQAPRGDGRPRLWGGVRGGDQKCNLADSWGGGAAENGGTAKKVALEGSRTTGKKEAGDGEV